MRIVWKDEEFEAAWDSARAESGAAFGNDGMYLEKYVQDPRHNGEDHAESRRQRALFAFARLDLESGRHGSGRAIQPRFWTT